MDMSLRPNHLNLEIENRRVRRAVFGAVTCRISGSFRLGLTGDFWPLSGAVSGRSTLLSGLFRRQDSCKGGPLPLALAAGVTLESVAPASTGPGPSSTKKEEGYGWEG